TKPIQAKPGQASRGGRRGTPRPALITRSSATPRANRVKISVTGEISFRASLVATNEIPQKTIAARAPSRGAEALRPFHEGRRQQRDQDLVVAGEAVAAPHADGRAVHDVGVGPVRLDEVQVNGGEVL